MRTLTLNPQQQRAAEIVSRLAAGALDEMTVALLMQVCVDYEREIGHPNAEANAEAVAAIRHQIEEDEGENSQGA